MTLQQLKYFDMVAKTQHFSKAAAALNVSQPTLSYSISKLEEELGVPLFTKNGRNIDLTAYGNLLQEHVTRVFQELDRAEQAIRRMRMEHEESINISYVTSMGISYVPKLIQQYYVRFPQSEIHFNLLQRISSAQAELLKSGEIDLAFGSFLNDPDLESYEVYKERLVLAVSRQHPLAARNSLCFDDFSREKFVTFLRPAAIRQQIDQLFADHGCTPNIVHEVTNEIMVAGIVATGECVGLIPHVTGAHYQNVKLIHMEDCVLYRSMYMFWKKDRPLRPTVQRFQKFVYEQSGKAKG